MSTATITAPDLGAIKAKQQVTWSSGDFSVVAQRVHFAAEQLVESANLHPGWKVLDIATGSGNAALAAARGGCTVTGIDYVPALLDRARERAAAERVDATFREGDAEAIPAADASFDATLSIYGTMFAPDQAKVASEILRVTKPGGRVALASWTPTGFIGEMFRTIGKHVPPPAGLSSPMRWGTEDGLRELFGEGLVDIRSTERVSTFRFRSADEFVSYFREWYGPTLKAFAALDAVGQAALAADLSELAARHNVSGELGLCAIPATYLETIARRA